MWLINVKTKTLEAFVDDSKPIPPYAILSHTWGPDHEEISFQGLRDGKRKAGLGRYKFDKCCSQAISDGFAYAWIDTCCIDKTNSTELSEAINSMFKWYENAQVCYAYLNDVDGREDLQNRESSFWRSRWFQRGWTLQELVAPANVRFYDAEWRCLGVKRELAPALVRITGIPRMFLLRILPLRRASVAQRMNWASRRVTKRKEDLAYCLLGIFGITMPMIYGEGDRAFIRLQEEILRQISDDSILAWNFSNDPPTKNPSRSTPVGALACSPSSFASGNHIIPGGPERGALESLYIRGSVLLARRRLHTDSSGQCFVVLQCQHDNLNGQAIGIPVKAGSRGDYNYVRQNERPCIQLPKDVSQTDPQDIRILVRHSNTEYDQPRYAFIIENALANELELTEVMPRSSWGQEKDIIILNSEAKSGRLHRIWMEFQLKQGQSDKFILVLEIALRKSALEVRHHLMTCDGGFGLEEIKRNFAAFDWRDLNNHAASNGALSLKATVSRMKCEDKDIFTLKLLKVRDAPNTYNVAWVLHQLRDEKNLVGAWKRYRKAEQSPALDPRVGEKREELNRIREGLAELQGKILALQEEQYRLLQLEEVASSDLAKLIPDRQKQKELSKREKLLDQALTLQIRFDQRGGVAVEEEIFDSWDEAAAKKMLRRLPSSLMPSKLREDYEQTAVPAHRFLLAAARAGYEPPFRQLAKQGIDVNIATKTYGHSLLMGATMGGNKRIVQTLLTLGANVKQVSRGGRSALHVSMDADITRLLLHHGAEIDKKSSNSETALMLAAARDDKDIGKALVEHGANMERRDSNGRTALMIAALGGHEAFTRLLVEHGAELEEKDSDERTALLIAAAGGHEPVVRLLLEHGAKLEEKDSRKRTAIMLAAFEGQEATARLLVEYGARLDGKDTKGRTASMIATNRGHETVGKFLADPELYVGRSGRSTPRNRTTASNNSTDRLSSGGRGASTGNPGLSWVHGSTRST
ncbi:hypothetical protein F4861DRAFT_451213 [Xylaria intraflava]|nr:hypothetical protein F4861DRAFT_451213 [Xylaria intraflava]